jgi:hypothetical protein
MNGWNHGYGRFGICAEAIKKGAIGRCVVSGWAIAQVNIMADWHFRCDVDFQWDERIFLRSYAGGTGRIVWKDTGRDAKWCVVSLGNNPVVKYYGTLLDTLKPNGSVQMTIYRWHHLNTWWTSTGWTEWVHCPPLIVNTTVSYGKKISAIWDAISHRLILDGYE